MRAVMCSRIGALDHLAVQEVPTPDVGPEQVLVAVRAAGVGFVDGLIATGRYQAPRNAPYTPGGESAGVIEAVGTGVDRWQVGDRVLASTGTGAFAECVVARSVQLTSLPDSITFSRAASCIQAYCTAWFTLRRRTAVHVDETVLVTGAGGGVGLAAVDVATALGARVIAVASSAEKRALARKAGADATFDATSEDLKVRARELTGGKGVDVVYDVVGGPLAESALRALKFGGRYCVIGFTGGIASIPMNLVLLNNRTMVGVEWGGWAKRHPAENRALIAEVIAAVADGQLHPVEPLECTLEAVTDVLRDLLNRRSVGTTVLVP